MGSSERLLINEASVPTGVAARKINQLLVDEFLPDSAPARVATRQRLHACAVPMVSLGAAGCSKPGKGVRLDMMRKLGRCARKCRRQQWRDPGSASGLRFDGGGITISLGKRVA